MQWGIPAGHAIDDETVHNRDAHQHVRALLSDTDKSILDIALTAAFVRVAVFTARSANMSACHRTIPQT